MFKTVRSEIRRFQGNPHVTMIEWECSKCKRPFISIQQQQFSHCPHCGVKFTHKRGGEV